MKRTLLTASTILLPLAARAGLTSITIANPSFHDQTNFNTFPGYLGGSNPVAINAWSAAGGVGINSSLEGAGLPFSDGTTIDGERLAFIQGGGSLTQTISGLTPGQRYVFQGLFRARNTPGVPVFNVDYGAQSLIAAQAMTPGAAWQAFSVPFIAGAGSGALAINSAVPGGGDGTLTADNLMVFQLNSDYANIFNPSFESGVSYAFPGYQNAVGGWSRTGGGGYNHNIGGNNPFADNGAIPEGQTVAFIQNNGSFSQLLSGLTPGQQYLLEIDYNSRAGFGSNGHIHIELGGSLMLDTIVSPVGGSNPYHHLAATWTAGGASALLDIQGIQNGSDSTVVFDNITLRAIPEPSASVVALLAAGALALRRRK